MRIGPTDTERQVAIVAEIGNNHEGDLGVARELVHAAAGAGAHAVKFQAIEPSQLVHPDDSARLAQLERFRLGPEQFAELAELARSLGIGFVCTPFSLQAVPWLVPLVDAFKIASSDNDYVVLLERVGATGRPAIVSSGMTDAAGLRRAQQVMIGAGTKEFAVLHCVSAYPTPAPAARLATIPVLARDLRCTVGYSDHTIGLEACLTAVALGARILEKHLTLRHDFSEFRDHQLSAEPAELRELVDRVAEVEVLIGQPRDSAVLPEEMAVAAAARRSAVAARDLAEGQALSAEDVHFLRPSGPVGASTSVVGSVLRRARRAGDRLERDDLGPRS
jgi:N,N'-diacetyllegionaminate synthase